jgi:hypothetical protein
MQWDWAMLFRFHPGELVELGIEPVNDSPSLQITEVVKAAKLWVEL